MKRERRTADDQRKLSKTEEEKKNCERKEEIRGEINMAVDS